MLTPRELQIAGKLLASRNGLRVKDLAEELKVSARTIQYDLDNVKDFLGKIGVAFCSSSGKGIWVECADDEREAAQQELSRLEKSSLYFNQEMRIQRILLQLIFQEGYVTAGSLADSLNVSRNTILSDIDHMAALLDDSGLLLNRQARHGYKLEGKEIALRTLAETLLQEGMSVYDIYQMISQLRAGIFSDVFPLPLSEELERDYRLAQDVIAQAFREHPARLQTENVVLLLIRLLISIIRVRMQRFVGNPVRACTDSGHYLSAHWQRAFTESGLPVLQDEVDYILGRFQEEKLPVDIAGLSAELVEQVSRMEDFPYYEDKTLYPRLLTHLRYNFSSEKRHTTPNPFHDLVLQNHARLYKNIKAVCKKYVDSAYLFPNDSFVSYLALHFLLAQKNLGVGRKLRVVFVCSTGRGAAKLLERMLEAELRQIQIVQHCSLTEVDEVVESLRPDFIISVFPISAAVPVVLVEPLPTKANIEAIRQIIDRQTGDDEGELLYHSQPADPGAGGDKQEELSQEAILAGLKIYAKLRESTEWAVKADLEFAFLAHVMLLANRYVFDKQLTRQREEQSALGRRIKDVLAEIDLHLTQEEIKGLTYYLEYEE